MPRLRRRTDHHRIGVHFVSDPDQFVSKSYRPLAVTNSTEMPAFSAPDNTTRLSSADSSSNACCIEDAPIGTSAAIGGAERTCTTTSRAELAAGHACGVGRRVPRGGGAVEADHDHPRAVGPQLKSCHPRQSTPTRRATHRSGVDAGNAPADLRALASALRPQHSGLEHSGLSTPASALGRSERLEAAADRRCRRGPGTPDGAHRHRDWRRQPR